MSAQAQLSKASYSKKNSATLMQTGVRTAYFSLFPVGSTSAYSDNIGSKPSDSLSVQGHFLPVLLLNACWIAALLLFPPYLCFVFATAYEICKVKGHILSSVISCRVVFVVVNSQEIVAEWTNEWKNDKNWRAVVGESLGSLVKRITKLRSD